MRWAGSEGKRRVQVVPELIDARTGSVKWQQSFDNDITDVFEVQSQIASRVAGALGVALAGGEKQEWQPPDGERRGVPAVPEGARHSAGPTWRRLREQIGVPGAGGGTGLDFLRCLGVALDREFAPVLPTAGPMPEVGQRAKEALDRAMTLNPQSYRTNLAAARYHELVSRDYAQADAAIERALQAAPTDAEVLASAALTDQRHGDRDAAVAKLERARETRPPVVLHASATGRPLCRARRWADAEAVYSTALLLAARRPGHDLRAWPWLVPEPASSTRRERGSGPRSNRAYRRRASRRRCAGRQEVSWIMDERTGRWCSASRRRRSITTGPGGASRWRRRYWQPGDTVRARAYADSALR